MAVIFEQTSYANILAGLFFVADFATFVQASGCDKSRQSLTMDEKPDPLGTVSTSSGRSPAALGGASDGDRLESWKEIAAFLGCDVRTAMRWEKLGLPVRRIPSLKRSRVYAFRAELSLWRFQQTDSASTLPPAISEPDPERNSKEDAAHARVLGGRIEKKHFITGIVICMLALLTFGLIARRLTRPGLPATVRFTQRAMEAFDDGGRPLWTHTFAQPLVPSAVEISKPGLADFVRVGDFRGDGEREVVVVAPVRSGPNPSDSPIVEVDCFSSRGALLWSYVPNDSFKFGDDELKGPWLIFDVMISHEGRKRSIWVIVTHRVWGNSFVVELDAQTGRGPVRFVNTGTLYQLHELRTSDHTYLLVAGFNNEYGMGSLAALDEAKSFATSPQTSGTRNKCETCPAGDPDFYFLFPRSEINTVKKAWLDAVRDVAVDGNEIRLTKFELPHNVDVITLYLLRFEPIPAIVSLRYSSVYDLTHRDLERRGEIGHSLANCPERLQPKPARVWTPSDGWRELRVRPSAP